MWTISDNVYRSLVMNIKYNLSASTASLSYYQKWWESGNGHCHTEYTPPTPDAVWKIISFRWQQPRTSNWIHSCMGATTVRGTTIASKTVRTAIRTGQDYSHNSPRSSGLVRHGPSTIILLRVGSLVFTIGLQSTDMFHTLIWRIVRTSSLQNLRVISSP